MYLHLGQGTVVPFSSIIGVFDLDNASSSHITRAFLGTAEKTGNVVNAADDIPKSFVLCSENGKTTVYLSQLASATLLRRSESGAIDQASDE
ncbi:MAG: DUF370 domain-containing protein [Oscillospiraceae bacterium]|nr:DUF370 domain-containing protein [Oscillospiraceae bacterium]